MQTRSKCAAQGSVGWDIAVFGQVGEGHAVVGEHGVYLVREVFEDLPEEGRTFILPAQSRNSTQV
ncbi:hypothetical protein BQ8794_180012 [Mesorhizobium prunaredense]|uniref:Uncharacterized protein n=1 Tax=Mesorhizobium prunaredense TaxID=1631249 RepID=A0A1R3V604_9HYPH|nr:hypothetical protein BQ8794_180012 [Mesorhizobium prunaredense]